jgi:hypothetical protein
MVKLSRTSFGFLGFSDLAAAPAGVAWFLVAAPAGAFAVSGGLTFEGARTGAGGEAFAVLAVLEVAINDLLK